MKKILWIDDDNIILDSLLGPARDEGYGVDTFKTLDEVLKIPAELISKYNIVVIDLSLPSTVDCRIDNEGLEFIRQIRDSYKLDVPIIVLSGYKNLIEAVESLNFSRVTIIAKPIRPSMLLNEIHKSEAKHD